ncbi:DUF4337 domain-containing protein [Acidithiobacillus thiooxidans]|nr:DUF4337 domain-containing protein [Acidithiobacillus thiooxidans]
MTINNPPECISGKDHKALDLNRQSHEHSRKSTIDQAGEVMSGHGLHSHPPHEEMVHHAAGGHGGERHSLSQWVAIFTAILAAFGAIVSYQGTHLMNEVLLQKNEAVLEKAKAADQWNYYQAVSTKLHMMELAIILAPNKSADFKEKIAKYEHQKVSIQQSATEMEQKSEAANRESAHLNRPHNDLEIAMIFLQIAISLASITALTRRKWLFAVAGISAAGGIGLWISAIFLF